MTDKFTNAMFTMLRDISLTTNTTADEKTKLIKDWNVIKDLIDEMDSNKDGASSFPFKDWDHFRIITDNAIDADLAVMNLDMLVDHYGYCTVKDLYDVCYRFREPGTTPEPEDTEETNNYGWTERGFAVWDQLDDYVRLVKAPRLLTWQDKNKDED